MLGRRKMLDCMQWVGSARFVLSSGCVWFIISGSHIHSKQQIGFLSTLFSDNLLTFNRTHFSWIHAVFQCFVWLLTSFNVTQYVIVLFARRSILVLYRWSINKNWNNSVCIYIEFLETLFFHFPNIPTNNTRFVTHSSQLFNKLHLTSGRV